MSRWRVPGGLSARPGLGWRAVRWALAGLLVIAGIVSIIGAISQGPGSGNDEAGVIAFGVVIVLAGGLVGASARWGFPLRPGALRGVGPGARANPGASGSALWDDGSGGGPAGVASTSPTWGRASGVGGSRRFTPRRPRDPRWLVVWLALFVASCGVIAIVNFETSERSGYTQAHGIHDIGMLGSVNNAVGCDGRGGCTHTFSAPISLLVPVDGHDASTVHGPGNLENHSGTRLQVLVDPKDPAYSEFPGHRLDGWTHWVFWALATLFWIFCGVMGAIQLIRRRLGLPPLVLGRRRRS